MDEKQDPPTPATLISAQKKRRTFPVHPLLFGIYPVLALLARNFSQTPLNQTTRSFAIAIGTALCIWFVLLLLTRKLRKSAVVTSAAVIGLFSYGHLVILAPALLRPVVMPGIAAMLLLVAILALRTKQPLYDATAVLNFAAVVLVAPSIWSIAADMNAGRHVSMAAQPTSSPQVSRTVRKGLHVADPNDPDIYYIILDAYGRADRLKEFFGYDNEPFLKQLEQRGFYVADKSGANYNQTPLCLASALNMSYLDSTKQTLNPERLRQMVDDSSVAQYLENRGYQYVSIWSGLEVSRVTTADVALNNQAEMNAFETQALNLTPIAANSKMRTQRYNTHRNRLIGVFDNLETVARLPGPKFVFAHALAPHPPFVVGANGEKVYPVGTLNLADGSWLLEQISKQDYIKGYTAQVEYVNLRVLKFLDAILAQSAQKPIIIIQGDHGSRMTLDWGSQDRTDLREPFANLNTYLVPAKVAAGLYKTITPVNSFRVILSRLFHADYPILKDRSFYSTADEPTKFSEVTDLIPLANGPAAGMRGSPSSSSPFHRERGEQ